LNAPLLDLTASSASFFNQPGGVAALRLLGLSACLEGIDAVPVHCYAVLDAGEIMHTPHPCGTRRRSFRRGCFIQNLRAHARAAPGVDLVEANRNDRVPTHAPDFRCAHTMGWRGTGVILRRPCHHRRWFLSIFAVRSWRVVLWAITQ